MNGGYIMLDFAGVDLAAEEEVTISGIYNKVKEAYESNKLILLYNVKNDDVIVSPIPVFASSVEAGGYIANVSTISIAIDEDDGVTISSVIE